MAELWRRRRRRTVREADPRAKTVVLGQRRDGRYLVRATVESRCEACLQAICVGDVIVLDDFGQWVHDACQA